MRGAIVAGPLECPRPDAAALLARARFVRGISGCEMRQRDGEPGIDHGGRQVDPADAAGCNSAAIIVDALLLASHALALDQCCRKTILSEIDKERTKNYEQDMRGTRISVDRTAHGYSSDCNCNDGRHDKRTLGL
ncbi:hypothetical protein GCM10011393_17680 [Sphingopyxis bauzanensis]|nr:hypothetical protein GCM10011393_17680 [Sphingopyxis bauzanensis]